MDITAIIPVRAGSRRLKNKNVASFAGTNLLLNKIEQLKKVPEIARIVVSSDSDMMLSMAVRAGVSIHKRAPEFCDEVTKSFGEVVRHIAENVEGEHILWATCTSPLVFPDVYSKAISEGLVQQMQAKLASAQTSLTEEQEKHRLDCLELKQAQDSNRELAEKLASLEAQLAAKKAKGKKQIQNEQNLRSDSDALN